MGRFHPRRPRYFRDPGVRAAADAGDRNVGGRQTRIRRQALAAKLLQRSEEHTPELQSLMRISYAVFCLKTKTKHEQTVHQDSKDQRTTRQYCPIRKDKETKIDNT